MLISFPVRWKGQSIRRRRLRILEYMSQNSGPKEKEANENKRQSPGRHTMGRRRWESAGKNTDLDLASIPRREGPRAIMHARLLWDTVNCVLSFSWTSRRWCKC